MINESLAKLLKEFRLSSISNTLDFRLAQAAETSQSYEEFLELLFRDEHDSRADTKAKERMRVAKLPYAKDLSQFDFIFQPSLKKSQILELATGSFLVKKENIIFIGPPGVGKTHLSVALGLKALELKYSVLFTTVWEMITALEQSQADLSYKKKIEYYLKPDLLILDELGYKALGETTVEDFFEIVAKRYEKGSIIITSNRDLSEWDKIFIDKTLTGAILDRLIHHCHTFTITGESYRFQNRNK